MDSEALVMGIHCIIVGLTGSDGSVGALDTMLHLAESVPLTEFNVHHNVAAVTRPRGHLPIQHARCSSRERSKCDPTRDQTVTLGNDVTA
jgi:hypothetical protein